MKLFDEENVIVFSPKDDYKEKGESGMMTLTVTKCEADKGPIINWKSSVWQTSHIIESVSFPMLLGLVFREYDATGIESLKKLNKNSQISDTYSVRLTGTVQLLSGKKPKYTTICSHPSVLGRCDTISRKISLLQTGKIQIESILREPINKMFAQVYEISENISFDNRNKKRHFEIASELVRKLRINLETSLRSVTTKRRRVTE